MAKKQSVSSVQDGQIKKKKMLIKSKMKKRIDYSDIPASTLKELAGAKRVGRPSKGDAKQLIAIRIDVELLAKLKKLAAKKDNYYQTLIHEILEAAVKKAA